jgi:hypothetical protein
MSGKWNDISTAEAECYELLAPTARGVIVRQRREGSTATYTTYVEEASGAQHPADHSFGDLTAAKIWAENEIARTLGQQVGV